MNCTPLSSLLFFFWSVLPLLLQLQYSARHYFFLPRDIILWICKLFTAAMRIRFGLRILNQRAILFSFTFASAQPPPCGSLHTFTMQICQAAVSRVSSRLYFRSESQMTKKIRKKMKCRKTTTDRLSSGRASIFSFQFFLSRFIFHGVSRIEMFLRAGRMCCVLWCRRVIFKIVQYLHTLRLCATLIFTHHARKMYSFVLHACVIDVAVCSTHDSDALYLGYATVLTSAHNRHRNSSNRAYTWIYWTCERCCRRYV